MNWLIASGLMVLCSLILYLLARKSSLLKNSTEFTNLAMYLIPTIIFVAVAITQKVDLAVTPYQFLVLLIFSVLFGWLGNVASLKAIEIAPNPGYSLIISKSYVLMTTLVAYFFFNGELSLRSGVGILVIILGSFLLSIGKPTNNNVKQTWLPLSLLAFFCWGMISITSKYLHNIGVGVIPLLLYMNVIVTTIIGIELKIKKSLGKINLRQVLLLVVMGTAAAGFDYFMQQAFITAPNIGYVNALNAGSITLVTIGSVILYKDEFNLRKFSGVLVATIGLALLLF